MIKKNSNAIMGDYNPLPCLIDAESLSLLIKNLFLFKDFLSKTFERKMSFFPLFLT